MPRVLFPFSDLAEEDQVMDELEMRRRNARVQTNGLNVDMAQRLARLSYWHTSLPPGLLAAAAIGGLEVDDPSLKAFEKRVLLDQIEQRDQLQAQSKKPWDWGWQLSTIEGRVGRGLADAGSWLWEKGIQGTSRVATLALDAMMKEVVQGGGSFITGLVSGLSPQEAAEGSFGFSPGLIAARELIRGNPVNVGGGLTYDQSELSPALTNALEAVGGMGGLRDLTPEAAQQMLALVHAPEQQELGIPAWLTGELRRQSQGIRIGVTDTNPGRPFTGGRALADVATTSARQVGWEILEPGSDGYNILSGIGDTALNLWADPGSKVLKTVGAFRAANRALVADGVRPTIFQRQVDELMNDPYGRRMSEFFAESNDYQTNYNVLRHSNSGRRVPSRVVADLTDAHSPTETARIIHHAVQTGNLTRVPGVQSMAGRAVTALTGQPVGTLTGTVVGALTGRGTLGRLAGTGVVVQHANAGNVLSRWAMQLHGPSVDIHNTDAAVETLGQFLKLAEFDGPDISRYMHQLARMESGDAETAYDVIVRQAMGQWNERLTAAGLAPEKVRVVTNFFNEYTALRHYFDDLTGQAQYVPTGDVIYRNAGEIDIQPKAVLFSELLDRDIPLPTPRVVRETMRQVKLAELTSPRFAAAMLDTKPAEILRVAASVGSWAMSMAWKPLVLFRVAYAVRILAEEQLRMAGAGLADFVHHPAQYMALLFGRKQLLGGDLASTMVEHQAAMTGGRTFQALIGGRPRRRSIGPNEFIPFVKGANPEHLPAWTGLLSRLWSDELASAVARSVYPLADDIPPPAAIGALEAGTPGLPRTTSAGANVPAPATPPPNFVFAGPSSLDDVKRRFWDGDLSHLRMRLINDEAMTDLELRQVADAHIEMIWARINSATGGRYRVYSPRIGGWRDDVRRDIDGPTPPDGRDTYAITQPGDPRLIEAIATGRLDDIALVDASDADYARIRDHLGSRYYDSAPEKVAGPRPVDRTLGHRWDSFVESFFRGLIGVETDTLSRSPTWRQFYWKRVGQIYALADDPTRRLLLADARKRGVPRAQLGEWVSAAGPVANPMFDSLDGVSQVAKVFALEETQRLLYDLSRRRNFFEINRLLLPFGEAWNEIVTTWGRMMVEQPQVLRRASQSLQAMRGSGIFYPDPDSDDGTEIFNFPGSEFLAKWMFTEADAEVTGQLQEENPWLPRELAQIGSHLGEARATDPMVTPQLVGRVEGLNLAFGGIGPGFGPFVQYPAAQLNFLRDDPDLRWLHKWIFPFAEPDAETPGEIVDSIMPTWVHRAMQALGRVNGHDQRVFNNTIIDVQRAMLLSGEWKMSNIAELTASRALATERAKQLYLIRTLSSFAAITGAAVRWDVEADPDGRLYSYTVLATEHRKLVQQFGGDDVRATDEFLRRFGFDPVALVVPKSQQIVPRTISVGGLDWAAEHQQQFEAFPLTAYFARPDEADADFYQPAYLAQFKEQLTIGTPAREPVTPAQWVTQYNRTAGGILYQRAKEAVAAQIPEGRSTPNEAQSAWLRLRHAEISAEYPGFGSDTAGLGAPVTREDMIEELYRWHEDPVMANSDTGQGLALYLEARDLAVAEAAEREIVHWDVAQSTEDLRVWLQGVAQSVIMEHPDFLALYDRVLASEIETEDTPPPTSVAGIELGVAGAGG